MQSPEGRRTALAFDYDYVFRLEAVDECCGLGCDDHLGLFGCGLDKSADHVNGVGVEAKFGFVEDEQVRKCLFRLQEQGYEVVPLSELIPFDEGVVRLSRSAAATGVGNTELATP